MLTMPSPFPPFVAFAVQNAESCNYRLHPDEEALLSPRATPKRIHEFTLGRAAAQLALRRLLAVEPEPVSAGERGEPRWPASVVGAISHSHDLAVAAVARRIDCTVIGLDLQGPTRVDLQRIAPKICLPAELALILAQPGPAAERIKLWFSAKESLIKALPRLCLSFHDLALQPGPAPHTLTGRLQRALGSDFPAEAEWTVGWRNEGKYILTYFTLPA
ncbi:MAG TPA: 4'-phosphopantetheinyl transferase superfamily protein [bacterium]|nr:4'-phosphopantetheinyl transferase superfamily protein [bacterium]